TAERIKLEISDVAWYINLMLRSLDVTFDALAKAVLTCPAPIISGKDVADYLLMLTHRMGLSVGEVADISKRLVCANKPVDPRRMAEVLAGLWNDLGVMAGVFNLRWPEIFDANIAKLEARYSTGKFNAEESEAHRKPNLTVVE
ncbi:MAG: hypothetical protein LLG93_13565, partial [Deltaproteobacteria bacterium]|nr:hypothetical protein [Deltaproteobacteria bacterium]